MPMSGRKGLESPGPGAQAPSFRWAFSARRFLEPVAGYPMLGSCVIKAILFAEPFRANALIQEPLNDFKLEARIVLCHEKPPELDRCPTSGGQCITSTLHHLGKAKAIT
jgi:hypothetical protein